MCEEAIRGEMEKEQWEGHKGLSIQVNRRLREVGMNKSQLARAAEVDTPTVYRFLDVNSNPTIKTAFRFAAALGCTLRIELIPLD